MKYLKKFENYNDKNTPIVLKTFEAPTITITLEKHMGDDNKPFYPVFGLVKKTNKKGSLGQGYTKAEGIEIFNKEISKYK